jgi:extracellular elastinolytic metalloproteinase
MIKKSILLILLSFSVLLLQAQKTNWKNYQSQLKDSCKLDERDFQGAEVSSQRNISRGKTEIIWLQQTYLGLPIQGADMQLVLSNKKELVSQQCRFISLEQLNISAIPAFDFQIGAAKAFASKGFGEQVKLKDIKQLNSHKWKAVQEGAKGIVYVDFSFWLDANKLPQLVYSVRFSLKGSDALWQVRVNAQSGEIIDTRNLTLSCSFEGSPETSPVANLTDEIHSNQEILSDGAQYRVFPYPLESPLNGPRELLLNPADILASPNGWHDLDGFTGADETRSSGNNVSAYDDQDDDDFPDDYVDGGSLLNFDFPYAATPNSNPLGNREASITNLFYANNRIHDVLWYYGFDEEGGNFQLYNYTGGGIPFDAVNAEAFDGSGTNNANFATPPDGESPRMQMYLWANNLGSYLTINSPTGIAGTYPSAVAAFGMQMTSTPITAQVVEYNDGSINPSLACDFSLDMMNGKIALIDRGVCNFITKVLNAQDAGAIAVIMVNNQAGQPFSMGGIDDFIFIPSIMVSQADGNLIRAQLASNVSATININSLGNFFDSSFDNGVIAHEYGHGVSNRLTGGPSLADCLFNEEQMGEGWSDFLALIMTTTSANSGEQARGIGNYVQGNAISGTGIRPYPYSRDMTINPVVYDDIQELSIPHGLGSVWCSMLWDLYWNMVDVYGFDSDLLNGTGGNNKTIQLVMDGMALQPCSPGFIDGRDAILLADELANAGANKCLIWSTFARRGLGYTADQGSSESAFDNSSAFDIPPFCSTEDFANFTTSQTIVCAGSPVTFTDITQPLSESVVWTFEGGFPASSSEGTVDVTFSTPGTYTATMVSTTNLGSDDRTQSITVVPQLSINAVVTDASLSANNGSINITVTGGLAPYFTSWEDIVGLNDLTVSSLAPGVYEVTITDQAGCSLDTVFTVERPEGLEDITGVSFQINPNPFNNDLSLRFENATQVEQVRVYDLSGRILYLQKISLQGKSTLSLPLAHLSAGTYIIQVQFSHQPVQSKRVIKF